MAYQVWLGRFVKASSHRVILLCSTITLRARPASNMAYLGCSCRISSPPPSTCALRRADSGSSASVSALSSSSVVPVKNGKQLFSSALRNPRRRRNNRVPVACLPPIQDVADVLQALMTHNIPDAALNTADAAVIVTPSLRGGGEDLLAQIIPSFRDTFNDLILLPAITLEGLTIETVGVALAAFFAGAAIEERVMQSQLDECVVDFDWDGEGWRTVDRVEKVEKKDLLTKVKNLLPFSRSKKKKDVRVRSGGGGGGGGRSGGGGGKRGGGRGGGGKGDDDNVSQNGDEKFSGGFFDRFYALFVFGKYGVQWCVIFIAIAWYYSFVRVNIPIAVSCLACAVCVSWSFVLAMLAAGAVGSGGWFVSKRLIPLRVLRDVIKGIKPPSAPGLVTV